MTASQPFVFGTRMLKAGEEFDADDQVQANLLAVIGRARFKRDGDAKRHYRRRDLQAE